MQGTPQLGDGQPTYGLKRQPGSELEGERQEAELLGGARGSEVQLDPFEVAKMSLRRCIQEELRQNLMQVTSLRSLGHRVHRCLMWMRCKLLPMVGDFQLSQVDNPSIGPVHADPSLATWVEASGMALNHLSGGLDPMDAGLYCQSPGKKVLLEQLRRFDMWDVQIPTFCFTDFFAGKGIDYSGDEVKVAQQVIWRAVEKSLPEGVGTLELERFCTHGTKFFVEQFEHFLVPLEDQWLGKPPKVMVEKDEWSQLCQGLVSKGVCTFLELSKVYHIKGQPLLHGLFSVGKNEWDGGLESQRLIMNMVPLNQNCRNLQSDIGTLPSLPAMNSFLLEGGETLLLSSEDIRCFFYLFRVPREWIRFLCFNKQVPDHILPADLRGKPCVLASLVLPMGWLNSVGIAQHVHRNVVRWSLSQGSVCGGAEQEIRKDRPFPQGKNLFRVYLDKYDQLEVVDSQLAGIIQGTPSAQTLALREMYEVLGLPRHPKKAVNRAVRAEVQGALIIGDLGVAIPKPEKILQYCKLCLELLAQGECKLKELQVVAGGFVYFCLFRRPLLSALNQVWVFMEELKKYPPVVSLPLPDRVVEELVRFLGLVPLAQLNFRAQVQHVVSCSDASLDGGGICCSTGLTEFGLRASLSPVRGDLPEIHDFEQVLTIGMFDGIGALRVACDRLQLPMAGHISIEKDDKGRQIVEAHYPDTVFHDDVTTVSRELVQSWALRFSSAAVVLVGAGPPCQGVSGLNCDRRGALKDHRSKLFQEVPRVTQLVRECFPWAQVHQLMESVSSMGENDRRVMSEAVEMEPWCIDSLGLTLCRRSRLYWITWELAEQEDVRLWEHEAPCRRVEFQGVPDQAKLLEAGWELAGEQLPTFTTARPSQKPGRKPAGLQECSCVERERWVQEQHRFPPYQYRYANGVVNQAGNWRVPSVEEREVLMGFPRGYTGPCRGKGLQKGIEYENDRMTLIGNSWQVGVVMYLLSCLFSSLGMGESMTAQAIRLRTQPGQGETLSALLRNPPFAKCKQKWEEVQANSSLVRKLMGVVSIKGEDLLLQSSHEAQACLVDVLEQDYIPKRRALLRKRAGLGLYRVRRSACNALLLHDAISEGGWYKEEAGREEEAGEEPEEEEAEEDGAEEEPQTEEDTQNEDALEPLETIEIFEGIPNPDELQTLELEFQDSQCLGCDVPAVPPDSPEETGTIPATQPEPEENEEHEHRDETVEMPKEVFKAKRDTKEDEKIEEKADRHKAKKLLKQDGKDEKKKKKSPRQEKDEDEDEEKDEEAEEEDVQPEKIKKAARREKGEDEKSKKAEQKKKKAAPRKEKDEDEDEEKDEEAEEEDVQPEKKKAARREKGEDEKTKKAEKKKKKAAPQEDIDEEEGEEKDEEAEEEDVQPEKKKKKAARREKGEDEKPKQDGKDEKKKAAPKKEKEEDDSEEKDEEAEEEDVQPEKQKAARREKGEDEKTKKAEKKKKAAPRKEKKDDEGEEKDEEAEEEDVQPEKKKKAARREKGEDEKTKKAEKKKKAAPRKEKKEDDSEEKDEEAEEEDVQPEKGEDEKTKKAEKKKKAAPRKEKKQDDSEEKDEEAEEEDVQPEKIKKAARREKGEDEKTKKAEQKKKAAPRKEKDEDEDEEKDEEAEEEDVQPEKKKAARREKGEDEKTKKVEKKKAAPQEDIDEEEGEEKDEEAEEEDAEPEQKKKAARSEKGEDEKPKQDGKDEKKKKAAPRKEKEEDEDEEKDEDEEAADDRFQQLTTILDTDEEKENETRGTFQECRKKAVQQEKFLDAATDKKAERLMEELYKTRGLTSSNDDLVAAQRKMMALRKSQGQEEDEVEDEDKLLAEAEEESEEKGRKGRGRGRGRGKGRGKARGKGKSEGGGGEKSEGGATDTEETCAESKKDAKKRKNTQEEQKAPKKANNEGAKRKGSSKEDDKDEEPTEKPKTRGKRSQPDDDGKEDEIPARLRPKRLPKEKEPEESKEEKPEVVGGKKRPEHEEGNDDSQEPAKKKAKMRSEHKKSPFKLCRKASQRAISKGSKDPVKKKLFAESGDEASSTKANPSEAAEPKKTKEEKEKDVMETWGEVQRDGETSLRLIGKLAKKDPEFVVPTYFQLALDSLEEETSGLHLDKR
eukprot:s30_g31.t2